jgi:hypothetical protein
MNYRIPQELADALNEVVWRAKRSRNCPDHKKKDVVAKAVLAADEKQLISAYYPMRSTQLVQCNVQTKRALKQKVVRVSIARKQANQETRTNKLLSSEEAVFAEMLARRIYLKRIRFRLVPRATKKLAAELTAEEMKTIAAALEQLQKWTGYHPVHAPLSSQDATEAERKAVPKTGVKGIGDLPLGSDNPKPTERKQTPNKDSGEIR